MEENRSLLNMGVDPEGHTQLTETARWSKLLAILVLSAFGLLLLLMIFLGSKMVESMGMLSTTEEQSAVGIALIAVFVIAGVIVGVLMSFLIKAANRIRLGLQSNDQVLFNSGLASLKNYFVMYGILSIIGTLFTLLGLFSR